MSSVHYFQRYSQPENVVTNNTLLLLSQLYNYSPKKFSEMINVDLGIKAIIETNALMLTIPSMLLAFIVFKFIRRMKKGSIGERILRLD